ncbi:hypothetical protein N7488_001211 [Penicillium malachiteum]|nr:hypothetical protein N7488_001211 [Penicillium malachiteum]
MATKKFTGGPPTVEDSNMSAPSRDEKPSGQDESAYELTGISLILVIIGLSLSIFLMSLDTSIISTAIPRITSEFHSTGDIACPMLIVGRAIAGAGAAGCFTGAFSIVAVSIPLEKLPVYIGILQATFGITTIIGPVLGGAFTQHATWRWCFWINLPLGAVTIITLIFFFKPPPQDSKSSEDSSISEKLQSFDLLGLITFAPGIIMILLALQWGGTTFAWKSATIIGLLVTGVLLLVIFALWQIYKGDAGMISPRIITERTMFFACVSEFFAMGAVYISIYYLPEWFQVVKGASSTKSGVMYLPLALSDVFAAISTGMLLKYIGYPNSFIILGTALMSKGTGLISTFTVSTSHTHWIPFQVLQGLGAGVTLSMPYVATQAVLKPEDIPVGTSILQCFQFFGASLLLAVAESIFENKLVSRLASMKFGEDEIQKILNAGSAEVRSVVPKSQLSDALQAYNYALTKTFYIATSVAAVALFTSLGIRWRSVKLPKPDIDGSVAKTEK